MLSIPVKLSVSQEKEDIFYLLMRVAGKTLIQILIKKSHKGLAAPLLYIINRETSLLNL